ARSRCKPRAALCNPCVVRSPAQCTFMAVNERFVEKLAYALRSVRPNCDLPTPNAAVNRQLEWNACVAAVACFFQDTSPAFDPGRFLETCGGLFDFHAAFMPTTLDY